MSLPENSGGKRPPRLSANFLMLLALLGVILGLAFFIWILDLFH